MTSTENARRARAGAVLSADGPKAQHKRTTNETQCQPGADECRWRLSRALRMGRLEPGSWGFNFTRLILRHSKRRNWEPTPKQLHSMRGLLADLAERSESLIDDGGDNDCAA